MAPETSTARRRNGLITRIIVADRACFSTAAFAGSDARANDRRLRVPSYRAEAATPCPAATTGSHTALAPAGPCSTVTVAFR